MDKLSLVLEVKNVDLTKPETWITALILSVVVVFIYRFSLPLFEKFLLSLTGPRKTTTLPKAGGASTGIRMDAGGLPRSFRDAWRDGERAYTTCWGSINFGSWIGIVSLFDPNAVAIHIGKELIRGFSSFQYLTVSGWIIIAIMALFAGNLLARALDLFSTYGWAGALAVPIYAMLGLTSFWVGFLAWPLIVVVMFLGNRGDAVVQPIKLGFSFLKPVAFGMPAFGSVRHHLFED